MWKLLSLSLLLLVAWIEVPANRSASDYLWENRLVLVFSAPLKPQLTKEQKELFLELDEDVEERHMKLFEIASENHPWRKKYRVPKDQFQVLLIGKDGGVKMRESKPVSPKVIFDRIDQMPMRRREMKKARSSR